MKSRRAISVVGVLFLLAAGGLAGLYLSGRRNVTTSSAAAYEAYRKGIENEHRFYFKEARVAYAKALALDPDFAMATLGLARTSEHDQALSLTERARRRIDRLNENERLHVDLQWALVNGKREEALKVARAIHEKYPDDIWAANMLCSDELGKGNSDRALAIFAEVLAVDPNNALAYNLIGYYQGYRGDYDKAIENLKKYQFMAPDQANPYDSLGEIQAYSGHYDEAIANLNRALAIKADFYESYGHLGVAYEGKGDYAKALENYVKAAQAGVNDSLRRYFLIEALRVAGESRDVGSVREIAGRLEAAPKDKYSDARKAACRVVVDILEGRPVQAEASLREMRATLESFFEKQPKDSGLKFYEPAWNHLMAWAKVAQGKDDEAIALYEEMTNPPNPWRDFKDRRFVYEGRAFLAALLAKKGELDRAEKLLEENRRWNPSWAPTRQAELTVAQVRREKVLAAAK
ncbi:MAG TPA: tetratricopeptide repeat protein [Thermoanaerobaculia bacterium]|nr:tetratricopeptide repeat protein [Thermoanaerobaculia bacterium]